jgi:NAD(P)-dependent dehydrogenase (short-subunit alcohol dehydrogenase family)
MPNVLITGANRGLGLEFTKQYAEDGWRVFACCRNPDAAKELLELTAKHSNLISIHTLDVGNFNQIDELAQSFSQPIDILLNNAGIYPASPNGKLANSDYDKWLEAFRINSLAPFKMAQAFAGQLEKGQIKKIINLTSKMGSIEDNTSGGSYLYRSSKTALNMIIKSLSFELAPKGISTIVLHPGWVQTDMGGPNGLINAQQSVNGMRKVIDKLTLADSGKFFAYDGKVIPW